MPALDWLPPAVRERSTLRSLEAGETLFRQGDEVTAIFAVESGRVRLVRHSDARHPVVLHTAHRGELFAEAALFARVYRCDAVAAVASKVRAIPKRSLLGAFRSDPGACERFMELLAHQIHALRARLEERNIRSARDRIVHHIALVGKEGRLVLDGTLVDLAAELGLTHEALYRALASLEEERIISRTRSELRLREKPPM